MAPPRVASEEAARMLAAAIIEEVLETTEPGAEDAQMMRGREEFAGKVQPELHHIFDAVLAEYAL